jgi:hypothetical protein
MASFDKVQNSVRAAADIQRRFATYNADASETLSVRIGIDAGEPVEDHSDLFGSTVQLASRLCSEAEANGIIVSGFARELCREEDAARFVSLGERRFKGFADKAQVSDLSGAAESPIAPNEALDHSARRSKIKEERSSRRLRTLRSRKREAGEAGASCGGCLYGDAEPGFLAARRACSCRPRSRLETIAQSLHVSALCGFSAPGVGTAARSGGVWLS